MKAFRTLLILQVFTFVWLATGAQSHDVDSLKALLANATEDTVQMKLEAALAARLMRMDMVATEAYALQVLARETRYPDHVTMADAHLAMGEVMSVRGRYSDQVNHLYVARRIYQKANHLRGQADTYNHLAGLYYNLGMYDQAIEYWKQAMDISRQLQNLNHVSIVFNNLGSVYMERNLMDSAWIMLDSAEAIQHRVGFSRVICVVHANKGDILRRRGELQQAEREMLLAVSLADSLRSIPHYSNNLTSLALLHLEMGRPDQALAEVKEALGMARQIGALPKEADALEAMAKTYMAKGEKDSANHYFVLADAANDSLKANANFSSITKDLFDREQQLIQEKEELVAAQQRQQERELRILFLAGLGLLAMAAIFLFARLRARRRMALDLEAQVQERTAALRTANHDLNKFIHQSSHDLRSPLTSIMGLADVALQSPGDERRYVEMMRGRAAHLDHAYTNLIQTLTIRERSLLLAPVQVCDLAQQAISEVQRLRSDVRTSIQLDCQAALHVQTDAYLLGVVLRNLLLNAVDFVRDASSPPHVVLGITVQMGVLRIWVRDKCEPITPEVQAKMWDMFYRGSNKSRGTGLGLYNVKLAADKLGGELSVNSWEQGNEVVLVVKV